MSRSTYIWVVTRTEPTPVAAFTVKHELAAWLERSAGDPSELRITRLRDGRTPSESVVLDPITLEPAPDLPEEGAVRWNVCPDCFDSHGGNACYDESGPESAGQGRDQPELAHGGGNAEDCPICSDLNLPYPFICTAHDEAHAAFDEHFKDAATWTEEGT